MIATQGTSHGITLANLPPDLSRKIAEHPQADVITAIINGRTFHSGKMEIVPGLEMFQSQPHSIRDLNNFHAHFPAGSYRSGWLPTITSHSFEKPHLVSNLEVLANRSSFDSLDLRHTLGGFSFRYLSESPNELWRQVDASIKKATIKKVTGDTPQRFGEIYKQTREDIERGQCLLEFLDEARSNGTVPSAGADDAGHLDRGKIELDLALAQRFWTEYLEPQAMKIFENLMSKGYAIRDVWT